MHQAAGVCSREAAPCLNEPPNHLGPRPMQPSQPMAQVGSLHELHGVVVGAPLHAEVHEADEVALLTLVCILGAAVQYVMTPKEYQATARIQIERRSLSPISGGQNPWLEGLWNMEYYPTQYQLLESRGLAEKVVVDLGLADDPFFNPNGRALVASTGGDADPESLNARVLGSLAQRLKGGLQVNPVRSTQLVDIVYRSSSPEFAARAANGFAEAFIAWGISSRSIRPSPRRTRVC